MVTFTRYNTSESFMTLWCELSMVDLCGDVQYMHILYIKVYSNYKWKLKFGVNIVHKIILTCVYAISVAHCMHMAHFKRNVIRISANAVWV